MKKISVILGVLLAVVLTHPTVAAETHAERVARACADDLMKYCAGLSTSPSIRDLRKGASVYNCLNDHLAHLKPGPLSPSCYDVMLKGGEEDYR